MSSSSPLLCQICGTPCGLEFVCPECCAIPYCSAEHRRAHLATHKDNCARLKVQLTKDKALGSFPFSFSKLLTDLPQGSQCRQLECRWRRCVDTTDRKRCGGEALCSFLALCGCHDSSLWARTCPLHRSNQRFGDIALTRIVGRGEFSRDLDGKKRRGKWMDDGASKIMRTGGSSHAVGPSIKPRGELLESTLESQTPKAGSPCSGTDSESTSKLDEKETVVLKLSTGEKDCWGLPEGHIPTIGGSLTCSSSLNSWSACYQLLGLDASSPVALLLHFPLTVFLGVSLAKKGVKSLCGTPIRVHYLGPQDELDALEVFGVLVDLLPGAKINIDFIGPDVSKKLDGRQLELVHTKKPNHVKTLPRCTWDDLELVDYQDINMVCPPAPFTVNTCLHEEPLSIASDPTIDADNQCVKDEAGTMNMFFSRGLYHDWLQTSNGLVERPKAPDLVIAPNAGLEAYPSWLPTIQVLSQTGAFTVFTDYGEEAIVRPANMLRSWGLNVGRGFINPFRQPLLRLDSGNLLPCYRNGFGVVLNDGP